MNPKFIELTVLLWCTYTLIVAQHPEEPQQNQRTPEASSKDDPTAGNTPPSHADNVASAHAKDQARVNSSKPHIIMIVVDDLGWNDVDWRDNSLHTPVIRELASQGVVLNHSYVQPVCSPSRAAFLSGFYPYHLGLQHDSLRATQKAYLPDNLTTLPQHLQKLGYRTHMAGKWHLGFCNWRYTPTYRGFDSFVGFYEAVQDYYTHIGHHNGYDFRHNKDVYYEANGTYSTFIFTRYIQKVITEHDVSTPLFVYLPYQSVHSPLQVPQVYIDRFCSHIHDTARRTKCGMIAVLDEGVGNITNTLTQRGMFNNTLLLFTTDNGGPVKKGANNWPLRGSKTTLWEGGTRAMAFLHAPQILKHSGSTYDGVIHAVDWLPTLVEAAGGQPVMGLDGVSQWQSLLQAKVPSARTEFLYNMDELKNNSALRQGKFKLLQGPPGYPDKWYPPPSLQREFLGSVGYYEELRAKSEGGEETRWVEMASDQMPYDPASKLYDFFQQSRLPGSNFSSFPLQRPQSLNAQSQGVVRMTSEQDVVAKDEYQLYDLEADPTEHHDVKDKYPDVFQRMRARLDEYRKSLVPANFPPHDPDSLPSHFHGVWSPGWC